MILHEIDIERECGACGRRVTARVPVLIELPERREVVERAVHAGCAACGAVVVLGVSFLVLRPELLLPFLAVIADEDPEERDARLDELFPKGRDRMGAAWHPAAGRHQFALRSAQWEDVLVSRQARGERRWLEALEALHQASAGHEIVDACRAFEGATWDEVAPTWGELHDAAASREDDDELAQLDNDAGLVRWTCTDGIAAVIDHVLVSFPDSLGPRVARMNDLSRDLEARIIDARGTLVDEAFEQASTAFRRSVLIFLADRLRERFQRDGRVEHLGERAAVLLRALTMTSAHDAETRGRIANKLAIGGLEQHDRTGAVEPLDEAIAQLTAALAQSEGWPSAGQARKNLGVALRKRAVLTHEAADLDAAIWLLEREVDGAADLNNLANALRTRFRRDGDIADLDRAIDHLRTAAQLDQDGPDAGQAFSALAGALNERNELRRSADDLYGAVDLATRAFEQSPPGRARWYAGARLIDALDARYAYQRDLKDLNARLHLSQQLLDAAAPDSPERAMALARLGHTLLDGYLRRPDAQLAVRAREALVQIADAPGVRSALAVLAVAQHRDGSGSSAEAREALRLAAQTADGAQHRQDAHERWAMFALDDGAWDEAASAADRALAESEQLADAQVDTRRLLLSLRATQGLTAAAAYAHARGGRPERAVEIVERGRARLMARAPAAARRQLANLADDAGRALAQRYLDTSAAADALEAELAAPATATTTAELMALRGRRDQLETALRQRRAEQRDRLREVRAQPGMADFLAPMSCARVQAFVRAHGIPVIYLATAPRESVALIVRADTVETVWLPMTQADVQRWLVDRKPWDELTAQERMALPTDRIHSRVFAGPEGVLQAQSAPSPFAEWSDHVLEPAGVRGGILAGQLGWVSLDEAVRDVVADLGHKLAPLAAIPEASLFLVPCGALSLLPVHAALGERTVRHAMSISALAPRPSSPRPRSAVRAVGDPTPSPEPLVWARVEAQAVAGADSPDCLIGEAATRTAVLDGIGGLDALHLACHGTHDADDPLASRLLLAQGTALDAREVRTLPLDHLALTALSACRTATTDARHLPDEALGLSAAFLAAGSASVIGALWQVNDRIACLVGTEQHRRWLGGQDPAEALAGAVAWLRAADDRTLDAADAALRDFPGEREFLRGPTPMGQRPVHWAAFVTYGW